MREEEMENQEKVVEMTETETREERTNIEEETIERIDQRGVIEMIKTIEGEARGKKTSIMRDQGGTEEMIEEGIGMIEETGKIGEIDNTEQKEGTETGKKDRIDIGIETILPEETETNVATEEMITVPTMNKGNFSLTQKRQTPSKR